MRRVEQEVADGIAKTGKQDLRVRRGFQEHITREAVVNGGRRAAAQEDDNVLFAEDPKTRGKSREVSK